jgi:hypothetical protein
VVTLAKLEIYKKIAGWVLTNWKSCLSYIKNVCRCIRHTSSSRFVATSDVCTVTTDRSLEADNRDYFMIWRWWNRNSPPRTPYPSQFAIDDIIVEGWTIDQIRKLEKEYPGPHPCIHRYDGNGWIGIAMSNKKCVHVRAPHTQKNIKKGGTKPMGGSKKTVAPAKGTAKQTKGAVKPAPKQTGKPKGK